jgi:uncharacterized protein YkwD
MFLIKLSTMKNKSCLFLIFSLFFISMTSCSKNNDAPLTVSENLMTNPGYSAIEIEVMKLLNEYRTSKGLKVLIVNDYISKQAKDHTNYMISKDKLSHDNFNVRSSNIVKELKATGNGENVAFGQTTAKAVVDDWINSPDHKKNIEGNFTHFGISIIANSQNRFYFTNIFSNIN